MLEYETSVICFAELKKNVFPLGGKAFPFGESGARAERGLRAEKIISNILRGVGRLSNISNLLRGKQKPRLVSRGFCSLLFQGTDFFIAHSPFREQSF